MAPRQSRSAALPDIRRFGCVRKPLHCRFLQQPNPESGPKWGNHFLRWHRDLWFLGRWRTSHIGRTSAAAFCSDRWSGRSLDIGYPHQSQRKVFAASGIITTVAGNGTYGRAGDGGPATAASLNYPYCVVVDSAGNLFIADALNNVVRKVSPDGDITTVAGDGTAGFSGDGGPAIAARLNFPIALALDALGNLFIADRNNDRVRKVSLGGLITTVAGNGSSYGSSGTEAWPRLPQ